MCSAIDEVEGDCRELL